jgi:hypothetical protein
MVSVDDSQPLFEKLLQIVFFANFRTNHPVKRYKPNDEKKPIAARSHLNNNNNNDSFLGGVHHPAQLPGQSLENQQLLPSGNFGLTDSKNGIVNGIGETRIKSELPDDEELGRQMGEKGGGVVGGAEVALGPDGEPIINANEIKKEASDDERDKFPTNLFTNEGLQPSYKDLDQIFDNSDGDELVSGN